MPTIATLIPAYNAAATIEEALGSVARQTLLPDEVIVVNDGPNDQTRRRVEHWISTRPGLPSRLLSEQHQGVSAARNAAIHATSAEMFAFLDANYILEPENHAILSQTLNRPKIVIAFGDGSLFDKEGNRCTSFLADKPFQTLPYSQGGAGMQVLNQGLWAALDRCNFFSTSGCVTCRDTLTSVGLLDESSKISEDRDLWLRVLKQGAFGQLPARLARKRQYVSSLSSIQGRNLLRKQASAAIAKRLKDVEQLGLSQSKITVTRAAFAEECAVLLYDASFEGVTNYRRTRRFLAGLSPQGTLRGLRGWVRTIQGSVLRLPSYSDTPSK